MSLPFITLYQSKGIGVLIKKKKDKGIK